MTKSFYKDRLGRPAELFKLIANVRNIKKRNLLRGYSSKPTLSIHDAEIIRRDNSLHDSMIVGAVLRGRHGLLDAASPRKRSGKKTSADLYTLVPFTPLEWRNEVCYSAGFINSMKTRAIESLQIMQALTHLESMDPNESLNSLLELARTHGASNFLSYKLAYIRSTRDLSPQLTELVAEIENEICHRGSPGLHFSALENLSSKISLFIVARRRISGLTDRVQGDFRRSLALSNFIPTPLDETDVAGFLLRATESSLIDALYSVLIIFNLGTEFESVRREFEKRIDSEVLLQMQELIRHCTTPSNQRIVTEYYHAQNEDSDPSLDLYRVSSAFLERPQYAIYRNKFDKVIGARLLADIIDGQSYKIQNAAPDCKSLLLAPDGTPLQEDLNVTLDLFYRTYLFLKYLENQANLLVLGQEEIKYIFENTVGLEALLTENEIRTLYMMAPPQAKSLVTVLALALYRKKSVDPDIDFEFRSDFISHVIGTHKGSILEFINDLLNDSPSVANYIVGSLDEVTLEKMYTLVQNASEASEVRRDILRAVGQKLNRIEYFIEADAISTRSKVSKLQHYFDSSRMYVDSVAMQKWLDTNPTISTEQYRALYRRNKTKISSVESTSIQDTTVFLIHFEDEDEYLVQQIAKDAFEQFCLNNEFGIQSYLGRRIRHNTLQGVMIETVDAVLKKQEHQAIMSTTSMRKSIQAWLGTYNAIIEKLRKEQLQFKSSSSLFSATLDFNDSFTKENIRLLCSTLRSTGGAELLNDLVIAFCWNQIAPQLENASRFIKTTLLNEANNSIEQHFFRYHSAAPENRLKSDLHDAVNEVFKKVASWFQVPQTGFISTSIRDLCHIILLDLGWPLSQVQFVGNCVDCKYTGISVHRIYDCLAVLLQNACKHGEDGSKIIVDVTSVKANTGSVLENVLIQVTSTVSEEKFTPSKERIQKAIDSKETGADMVTEGYTGIKKVKFITRATEGIQTLHWSADDLSRKLTLGFSLHAEHAIEKN
ncbi:MAG: hypothetical protein HY254_08735 [Burkholderiales bacterium]|nr:hypothetical protein [Burkholderiales bacterium]